MKKKLPQEEKNKYISDNTRTVKGCQLVPYRHGYKVYHAVSGEASTYMGDIKQNPPFTAVTPYSREKQFYQIEAAVEWLRKRMLLDRPGKR